jgi:ParB/RepB/Spo0J family partition protein
MEQQSTDRPVVKIPLQDINAKVYNVRGSFSPQDCVGLAKEIKEQGLLHPIQVERVKPEELKDNDDKPFRMIAGFRRYMAHRILGAETIEARIYEGISKAEAAIINFTENTSRKDLSLMQEARGLDHIKRLRSATLKELANLVGMSVKWVQLRLWIFDLEPAIQSDIEKGFLKTQHIDQIHALPPGEPRYEYVKQLKRQALTGEKPRKSLAKKNVFSKKVRGRTDIFELQDLIIENLGQGTFSRLPDECKLLIMFLGWCAGEATDMEIYSELRKIAEEHDLPFQVPDAALASMRN